MNHFLLPMSVRAHRACRAVTGKLRRTWDERLDERGVDEAVTRMIWLAVGIGVAVAATAFFVDVFDNAQANVPDPVAPVP
jgi:Flp pilus assembly protein TadB